MSAVDPTDASDLYELAPCGLMRTAVDGSILRVNHTLCSWLGVQSDELVGKKRLQSLLTMGGKIFHQTHWLPLLQMQGSVGEVQLEFLHRDGHALPVLMNALRRDLDGVWFHDIAVFIATDRKKYEVELLQARRRAEEALDSERRAQQTAADASRLLEQQAQQRAVLAEQLIGIVSHDLRTPLNAVLLGGSMLQSGELAAPQARTVGRIVSAASRANRLITDLLDFTQARLTGGLRVTRGPVDLHALIADCVDELRLASPGRMLQHLTEGGGVGSADPDRLAQVVTNLVSNALTYGTPELPTTITSVVHDHTLGIRVHNFGAPIPPQLLPHLFEPLRRGEQQVKLGSRSVGLGLYIVQQIAAAHGGEVAVESSEQQGTTFIVTIRSHP